MRIKFPWIVRILSSRIKTYSLFLILVMTSACSVYPAEFVIKQYVKLHTPLGSTEDTVRRFIAEKKYTIRYDRSEPFDRLGSSNVRLGQSHIWVQAYAYRIIFYNDVQIVWIFEEGILTEILVWTDVDAL